MSKKTFPTKNKTMFENTNGVNLCYPKLEEIVHRPSFNKPIKISTHSFNPFQYFKNKLVTSSG